MHQLVVQRQTRASNTIPENIRVQQITVLLIGTDGVGLETNNTMKLGQELRTVDNIGADKMRDVFKASLGDYNGFTRGTQHVGK